MKIKCQHGFFTFEPEAYAEVVEFSNLIGMDIVPYGDKYTFDGLQLAPDFSVKDALKFGYPNTITFEGEPWEVFERNAVVFDFLTGTVVPIASVTKIVKLELAANNFFFNGLIPAGAKTPDGQVIKNYSAWFFFSSNRFIYSEVGYVENT